MTTVRETIDRLLNHDLTTQQAANYLQYRRTWDLDEPETAFDILPLPGPDSPTHLDDLRLSPQQREVLWAAARRSPGWPQNRVSR